MGTCINCEGNYAETPDYQRFTVYRSDRDADGFVCSAECLKAVAERLIKEGWGPVRSPNALRNPRFYP